jgi:hypothetical protein
MLFQFHFLEKNDLCFHSVLIEVVLNSLLLAFVLYEGNVKSPRLSLPETRDKQLLGRDSDKSWCHRHTTSMIKLSWSQSMAPWALVAGYEQGEKLSA